MSDSPAQNVPDNSIRISIDRASSASRRLPLCEVSMLELILTTACSALCSLMLSGRYIYRRLCVSVFTLLSSTIIYSLQRPRERVLAECLLNGIICSSYRSYLETPTSSSRKEFILKLLSSDPSNYPDAPTGELWEPQTVCNRPRMLMVISFIICLLYAYYLESFTSYGMKPGSFDSNDLE